MAAGVSIYGKVLVELRVLRKLSQHDLAEACQSVDRHCGLTQSRIAEYENERRPPGLVNLCVIAEVLALTDREWQALLYTPSLDARMACIAEDGEYVDRRSVSKAAGFMLAGAAPIEAVERIAQHGDRRIDAGIVGDHEQLADSYALRHRTMRPVRLFGLVAQQADTLYGLLDRPASPDLESRLYVVAAGSHAQAGLLAWHAGDRTVARRYFALATDIAEDSRNNILRAQTLGTASMAHRGPGGRADTMMARAVNLAANADKGTQAWLHSWHALRLARANDECGFFTHMQLADQAQPGTADEAGFFIRQATRSCSQVGVEFAVGLKTLKRGDEAIEAFAVASSPRGPRDHAYLLVKRAEAHLVKRQPDPEAACADLVASWGIGRDAGAATALRRVHEVRDRFLKPCAGLACLAELDERLGRV